MQEKRIFAAELPIKEKPPLQIEVADHFLSRFLGFMGRKESNYGLYIYPCDSIHMFFMKFAIDAIFTDKNGLIVSIHINVKPGRFAFGGKGAKNVLEIPASLQIGRLLHVGEALPLLFTKSTYV